MGDWEIPLAEHLDALDESGYWQAGHTVTFGIVGILGERRKVEDMLARRVDGYDAIRADSGNERVTLAAVAAYARDHDGAVMYAHTKGAAHPSEMRNRWRWTMTRLVVRDWARNLERLEDHDTVGCHWLTPEQYPALVHTPFYGGNFWMADCEYLRTLPPIARGRGEGWVGLGDPHALDLYPGWPGHYPEFK
jgi:hypothetical protein